MNTFDWWAVRHYGAYALRSISRALVAILAALPLAVCVSFLVEYPATDKTGWMAGAAAGALLFVIVLRYFGEGRGILFGFWLSLLSLGFLNGVVGLATAAVRLMIWSRGSPVDPDDILSPAVIGALLFFLCNWGLLRSDPKAVWL
ncbi:MAG: hypothetical protein AB7F35_15480 [Acetobacteraceae bacterium]